MVEHVVLLSGGYESTGCLIKALEEAKGDRSKVLSLFFDYGQPYCDKEFESVIRITRKIGAQIFTVSDSFVYSIDKGKNKTRIYWDRNCSMLVQAHLQYPAAKVWFGCRAPWQIFDKYGDSNAQFARKLGIKHGFKIEMPFIWYPKFLVRRVAEKAGVGHLVFSSDGYNYE